MTEDIEKKIEDSARKYAESSDIDDKEIADLLSGDKIEEYAANATDPTAYNHLLNSLTSVMDTWIGEPLYCIHLIEAFKYDSFKTLAEKFRDNTSTLELIESFVELSLTHAFDETQNMGMDELNKYLPILKPWTEYLKDDEIYEAVNVSIETGIENLQMHIEDEDDTEIANQCMKISTKFEFLKENRVTVYDKIRQELDTKYSEEIRMIDQVI